jgi:hypothetical protein
LYLEEFVRDRDECFHFPSLPSAKKTRKENHQQPTKKIKRLVEGLIWGSELTIARFIVSAVMFELE